MRSPRVKRLATVFGAVALAATVASCGESGDSKNSGGGSGLEDMDPVTLTAQSLTPKGVSDSIWIEALAKHIEQETDGKVKFDIYYSSALVPPTEQTAALGDGRLHIASVATGYTPDSFPITEALAAFGTLPAASYPQGIMESTIPFAEAYRSDPVLKGEINGLGVTALSAGQPVRGYSLACTKPISDPEDLDGRRVRAFGRFHGTQAETFGMVPVNIAALEQYEALQRGTMDCSMGATTTMVATGLFELAKYVVPDVFAGNVSTIYGMNTEMLESLPEEVQELFLKSGIGIFQADIAERMGQFKEFAESVDDLDLTIVDPTPFQEALTDFNEKALSEVASKLPDSVDDPEGWVESFKDRYAYWHDVLVDDIGFPMVDQSTPEAILESMVEVDESKLQAFEDRVQTEIYDKTS